MLPSDELIAVRDVKFEFYKRSSNLGKKRILFELRLYSVLTFDCRLTVFYTTWLSCDCAQFWD